MVHLNAIACGSSEILCSLAFFYLVGLGLLLSKTGEKGGVRGWVLRSSRSQCCHVIPAAGSRILPAQHVIGFSVGIKSGPLTK